MEAKRKDRGAVGASRKRVTKRREHKKGEQNTQVSTGTLARSELSGDSCSRCDTLVLDAVAPYWPQLRPGHRRYGLN